MMGGSDTMRNVVCFGDSVTVGVPHVAVEDTFPRLLERRLNARRGELERVHCVNSGVGGENTAEGLARFDSAVARHQPVLVIVEFGLNDIRYEPEKTISPDGFAENLKIIHDQVRALGAGVLFTTPNPIINAFHGYSANTDYYEPWGGCNGAVEEYAQIVRDVAGECEAALCDVSQAFMDLAVEAEFDGACLDAGDLTCLAAYIKREDGVHPTTPGQRVIALELYRVIRERKLLA
jgi:lysophospholipase L1-like esterase